MEINQTKVIYIGDNQITEKPFESDNSEWVIPIGWYVIQDQLSLNHTIVYIDNKPINIINNIQINQYFGNKTPISISIIKTNKILKINDIIKYE